MSIRMVELVAIDTHSNRQVSYFGVSKLTITISKRGFFIYHITFIHGMEEYETTLSSETWDEIKIHHY